MEAGITLVVLAAGAGTRFGGLKQLEPLGPTGSVLLEYSVYDAVQAGFEKIVLVIRESCLGDFEAALSSASERVTIEYAFQKRPANVSIDRSKPWGTAHALLSAQQHVAEPFALCNADDYYGPSAFGKAADFLRGSSDPDRYAMLAYALQNTLPGEGAVSRGLCSLSPSGQLASIVEHQNISVAGEEIVSDDARGAVSVLDATDITSMNFWLFMPSIIPRIQSRFDSFLEQSREDPFAECQLPTIIGDLLQHDEITVDCLPHDEAWFGLTHRADRDNAATAIQRMHEDGAYPAHLWETVAQH